MSDILNISLIAVVACILLGTAIISIFLKKLGKAMKSNVLDFISNYLLVTVGFILLVLIIRYKMSY